MLARVHTHRDVVHIHKDIAPVYGPLGAQHAFHLDGVRRIPEARRIREPEQQAIDFRLAFHFVARRAGHRAHNGAIAPEQSVQQGGFTCIGPPADYDAHPIAHPASESPGSEQLVQQSFAPIQKILEAFPVGERHILFRKIQFEFEERTEFKQVRP